MRRVSRAVKTGILGVVCIIVAAGCAVSHVPRIAVELPEKYNTPDGMVVDTDGSILLCCPNFNDTTHPAKLLRIDADDQIAEVFTFPGHPETGEPVGALGIDVGRDGNYYIADNQSFTTNEHKSRLVRIVIKNGAAVRMEVLVTGFIMANAVCCHGDYVYVTETSLNPDVEPMPSGVYRFAYSEFDPAAPLLLQPGGADPHLVASFTTTQDDWRKGVGANGMGFDREGRMYVCNFGEASLLRFTFNAQGTVASQEVVAKGQGMASTDGLKIHPETGEIYIADFVDNAVHKVCPRSGKVTTVWQNENNSGGVGGLLDKPSEVCIRGNRLYVANIDLTMDGNEYDVPHTISVITLE